MSEFNKNLIFKYVALLVCFFCFMVIITKFTDLSDFIQAQYQGTFTPRYAPLE